MRFSEVDTQAGVRTLEASATVARCFAVMEGASAEALPVCDGDRLIGMVTREDLYRCLSLHPGEGETRRVREILSPRVSYCYDDQEFDDLAGVMRSWGIQHMLVIDRAGRLRGLVSLRFAASRSSPSAGEGTANALDS